MLTILEKVLLLQNVDLFSRVASEDLSHLAGIAAEIEASPGRVLYAEGDPPDGLYVVISGSVLMRRSGEEIDRIAPNAAFGIWALFDDEPRLATAAAVGDTRLLFLPRDDFYDILSDHVEMVEALFKHLVQRLRKIATVVEK